MVKPHVLIAEDEATLLNALKVKLEKEGYRVSASGNGEEALDIMKEDKPDLLLLDIVMPKMDGFEVLETMHKDAKLKTIPIIVISNSGQPVEVERAKSLGAVDCLVKAQFDPEEVVEKVKLYLPSSGVASTPAFKARAPSKAETSSKILVVEDDKFLRELVVSKLKKEGFYVLEAIDGEEGLQKTKKELPSLVLLDLVLPGIDGFEVLTRIKEDGKIASTPVIILSNLGQKEEVERGLKLGASDFLIKANFTPGAIVDKVKNMLGV